MIFVSIPLIREHQVFSLYFHPYRTFETRSVDVPSTVVFNPVKKSNTGIFSKTIHPWDTFSPIQNVFVHFENKLQESKNFLKQALVVSSVIDGFRSKQPLFENSQVDEVIRPTIPYHWLQPDFAQQHAF